tara:strand:- start:346 stop:1776 length:1431 start_codon:yes stop_codon:yes gene_type:complete
MAIESVYFFAEYPIEFAIWMDLAKTIRELNENILLKLVFTKESRISGFNMDFFSNTFDAIHEVDYVSHEMGGQWRKGFTPRNVHHSLTKVFPKAKKVYSQLSQIDFSGNSLAFTYLGVTLNQALFLKSMRYRPGVESVLFLSADSTQRSSCLTDYVVNHSQSLLLNFYFHFFGTAYIDVFWARVNEGFRTNTREYIHRNRPADYVFQSVYPFRLKSLKPGQLLLPISSKKRIVEPLKRKDVVFIGQPHYFLGGFDQEVQARFYKRLNTILDTIRDLHNGQRLIFKTHPGQTKEQISRINLDGFEIVTSGTSEDLFKEDNSISRVYGFSSSSLQTALCYGIKSYYLYRLFYDILEDLPLSVKRNWEQRWDSEYHPEMVLLSLEDWRSAKNEYSVEDISLESRTEAMGLLARVGIINSSTRFDSIKKLEELPGERWVSSSRSSAFTYVFFVLLFLPKVIVLFFFAPVRDLLKNLRTSI